MANLRELSETLRNPNGPYFADDTPAMLALESMIDTVGMANVLYALSHIAAEKAEHIEANWQDTFEANIWFSRANAIGMIARRPLMSDR